MGKRGRGGAGKMRLAGIVTRAGDRGMTGLAGGVRVRKTHPRVEALGSVDELNCVLGMARLHLRGAARGVIRSAQNDLFDVGADLAGGRPGRRVDAGRARALDRAIERHGGKLRRFRGFVLPGGTPAGAWCDLARAVCRRAERRVVAAAGRERLNPELCRYLNRLGDLLFILARGRNAGKDILWRPPAGSRVRGRRRSGGGRRA